MTQAEIRLDWCSDINVQGHCRQEGQCEIKISRLHSFIHRLRVFGAQALASMTAATAITVIRRQASYSGGTIIPICRSKDQCMQWPVLYFCETRSQISWGIESKSNADDLFLKVLLGE